MNNETDFKKVFCDSVAEQKGYTFKIAMPTISGLPDIYCVYPGFIPTLLEAKYIKDIPETGKFKRKIPYRPFQQEILKNSNRVVWGSAWCLLGLDCGDKKFCTLIDPDIEIVTHNLMIDPDGLVPIYKNKIDVRLLFDSAVPYLQPKKIVDFRTSLWQDS